MSILRPVLVLATVLVGFCFVIVSRDASARMWQRNGPAAAEDYLFITDNRGEGNIVMVMWFAPPMISPAQQPARELLSRYVVISTGAAKVDPATGLSQKASWPDPVLSTDKGLRLTPIPEAKMPPAAAGFVTAARSSVQQALGVLGQSTTWHVFEPGGVDACKPGELRVRYADETYTYKTPVPGCEVKPG